MVAILLPLSPSYVRPGHNGMNLSWCLYLIIQSLVDNIIADPESTVLVLESSEWLYNCGLCGYYYSRPIEAFPQRL